MNNWQSIVNSISMGIDTAFDEKDEDTLQSFVDKINQLLNNETFSIDAKIVLYYDLGNVYSYLDSLRNHSEKKLWIYNNLEHINAIKAYRKCINLKTECKHKNESQIFVVQSYTNLGNLFSESGRIIYAIEAWKKALEIHNDFGMAQGNLGMGLITYARSLYDQNHAALLCKKAYPFLENAIKSNDVYTEAKESFCKYKNLINPALLKQDFTSSDYFNDLSEQEKEYRKWVLQNSLFLNPLNDIYNESFVAHDILHLPNMIASINEPPKFHGLFNEIKQQFASSRYIYYSYLKQKDDYEKHFSDKETHLVNTFDYSLYGYKYELLKTAYKNLYSILDKIAFFLNDYLQLKINIRSIAFHTIWYEGKQKQNINPIIESLNNNPLRGLYYLSKDFHSDTEYLASTDDDAKELSEIRNCLEHRYVKITQYKNVENIYPYDDFAYQITIDEFERKIEKILHYVREAIIYLSLAVHTNEEQNYPKDKIIGPIIMGEI